MIKLNNQYDAILSFTSHSVRVKNILRTIKPIIQTYNRIRIILNLYKDDYQYLTDEIYNYINTGKIELFISNIDLGPHLKYFFTGLRYRNIPIIIIDDDIIYPINFIEQLLQFHKKYPSCILSRRPEKILFNQDGTFIHYYNWIRPYFNDNPVHNSLATGVGGILFPENFFNLNNDNINELLQKCKYDDDVYLKILAIRNNIMIKSVESQQMYAVILDDKETQSIALCNTNQSRTLQALNKFPNEILFLKQLQNIK